MFSTIFVWVGCFCVVEFHNISTVEGVNDFKSQE